MAAAGVAGTASLPPHLQASEPPEARGLRRDEVRLLVSIADTRAVHHARFDELPRWLAPGDLLVVNTSGTLKASLPARAEDGRSFELHLSTRLPGGFWVVEVRDVGPVASQPHREALAGTVLALPRGGRATLLAPYPLVTTVSAVSRLWIAALQTPDRMGTYLERFGQPIRYGYVPASWPDSMYQTIFATEPGSAEMPSAARPFTPELVTRLVAHGIQIAPILLHTGVASLEDHEPPYEEYYRVPPETAERVRAARLAGRRVIAVGTTVVRALETVTDARGMTAAGEGWTDLVVSDRRPLRAVNGLITGLHEPGATHLAMVAQVVAAAGGRPSHLDRAYRAARARGYLWHEFGDSHLIAPGLTRSGTAAGRRRRRTPPTRNTRADTPSASARARQTARRRA